MNCTNICERMNMLKVFSKQLLNKKINNNEVFSLYRSIIMNSKESRYVLFVIDDV